MIRVCPDTKDGVHVYEIKNGFMVCVWCCKAQVYTDNHSNFWRKVVK